MSEALLLIWLEVAANPWASVTGMSPDEVSKPFSYFIFVMLGPKRLTNPFWCFFFLASCTRSISFLTCECMFSLLLMGTAMRSLFVHVGTASTVLSGRQQWFSGGLFWKHVAILIYILSLSRIIFHFLHEILIFVTILC